MSLPTGSHKTFRIAILGIYHESNTFVPASTTLADFQNSRWLKGTAILNTYRNAFHELGGAIQVFSEANVEMVPVFYAEATPGGTISSEAYEALKDELLNELKTALSVDACFVVPHGAAVAENHRDMDGEWLSALRQLLGEAIPIIGTLDPHANVSPLMAGATQALFPYRTNPHIDQRETGRRAAHFLLSILQNNSRPVQRLWQSPVAISIEQQHTEADPCKSLYQFVRSLEEKYPKTAIEITLGFPYADVPEMGTSLLLISENGNTDFEAIEQELTAYFLQHKKSFAATKETVDETLRRIPDSIWPVLLLDMGDNVGGGSAGDSSFLLEKLESTTHKTLICLYAPHAVAACKKHTTGQIMSLSFGCHPRTDKAFTTTATLLGRYDGKFAEEKPRHGGQRTFDMGDTAVIRTEKGNTVLLHSKRMPPFSLAQITSCGIDPKDFDVIVAKGVNAPIAAYKDVCPTILQANTPGVTQADMTQFLYQHRRKPLYPFEDIAS